MKIVCIAVSFVPSTIANSIQVVKVSHALAELGHDVTLLVPGDTAVSWSDLRQHYGLQEHFDVRWLSENLTFRRYDFALKAVHAARRLKPDLVYTRMLQGAVLSLWSKIPVILELHDRVTGRVGPWLFKRFWQARTPHRLLTNTHALLEVLKREYNLEEKPENVQVAPNGVDLARYRDLPGPAEARAEMGFPNKLTVGYTGHFYAGRGMALMFSLAKELPDVNFLWVGGKQVDVAGWQARIQAEDMHNIILTGFVDNAVLPRYQAAADILLMPYGHSIAGSGGGNSVDICSPMKMFEYMAAGRAIISSDLPVIGEVLDESMAVFCPPEDVEAWRQALLALIADPKRRQSLGNAAKQAVGKYSWKARAAKALQGFI